MSIILGIAAGVATAAGAIGHIDAHSTNKNAKAIADEAEKTYNHAKSALEAEEKRMKASLFDLGQEKKNILDTSMQQFLRAYERIGSIQVHESDGLNEITKFQFKQQDALQIRDMTNIYSSSLSHAAAGAATGTFIALAATGSLSIAAETVSIAGSALLAGQVGLAAEAAGSAVAFGAAMTPLSAIAAPIVLFTGISSSIKAEENLEKAKTMQAEADAAAEKMKTSQVMCQAIKENSKMFNTLLLQLNDMFFQCAALADGVTKKKTGFFNTKKIRQDSFSQSEWELLSVTGALAKAIKSVIDTPILNTDGTLSENSQELYTNTKNVLPEFEAQVKEINKHHYRAIPVKAEKLKREKKFDVFKFMKIAAFILSPLLAWGMSAITFHFFKISKAFSIPMFITAGLFLFIFLMPVYNPNLIPSPSAEILARRLKYKKVLLHILTFIFIMLSVIGLVKTNFVSNSANGIISTEGNKALSIPQNSQKGNQVNDNKSYQEANQSDDLNVLQNIDSLPKESLLSKEKLQNILVDSSIETVSFVTFPEQLPDNYWDLSENQDGSVIAWRETSTLFLSPHDGKIIAPADCSKMFFQLQYLSEIHFNQLLDTSHVTNMSSMFAGCQNLNDLDLSGLNTSNVTDMSYMFYWSPVYNLNISEFDTSNVTDMSHMFTDCKFNKLDLSHFDTSNVTDMSGMFSGCICLYELDLSQFSFEQVKNTEYMFYGCINLEKLDIPNFDISHIDKTDEMFDSCNKLNTIVGAT